MCHTVQPLRYNVKLFSFLVIVLNYSSSSHSSFLSIPHFFFFFCTSSFPPILLLLLKFSLFFTSVRFSWKVWYWTKFIWLWEQSPFWFSNDDHDDIDVYEWSMRLMMMMIMTIMMNKYIEQNLFDYGNRAHLDFQMIIMILMFMNDLWDWWW